MESTFSKDITIKLRAFGIYQIAGGIIGLGLTVWLLTKLTEVLGFALILVLIALGLYAHSIYCGVLLLRNKISGLRHSTINQFLQLLNFAIMGYAFQYVSGVFLSIGIDMTNSFFIKFNLGVSSWAININSGGEDLIVNFNFIALFLILFIDRLKKKINAELLHHEITNIGK